MTKREIVQNTIQHKQSDKTPYAINFTQKAYALYGEQVIKNYKNEKVLSAYESGMLNLSEAVSLSIGNYVFSIGAPWWDWYNIQPDYLLADAPNYIPKTKGSGNYDGFFEKLKYIRENFDVYLLATVYGSHFEKANMARGIENFLADLAGEQDYAKIMLDSIIEKNVVMLQNFAACPDIDGILLGSDWGSQCSLLMSPDTWNVLIKPGELREYQILKENQKDIWIHSCGNIEQILPELIQMGVDVLNPVQPECMDVHALKDKYGEKLTFWGGVSTQRTLPSGTPQNVADEMEDLIKYMGRNGGYIAAPSQEIQIDVPYENLRALIDTGIKFG